MKFKRVLVRTRDVMLPFVVLLCINIAVLIAWTVHAPLHYIRQAHPGTDDWNREFSFYGECHSDHSTVYFAVVMVLEGICLVLAMYQTYKTRHYRTEFNESAYIGVAVVCICKCVRTRNCCYKCVSTITMMIYTYSIAHFYIAPMGQFKDLLWVYQSLSSLEIPGGSWYRLFR